MLSPELADGFDFPVGAKDGTGGYIDLQTGRKHRGWRTENAQIDALNLEARETWNGSGGGASDAGQPVYAMAAGRVVEITPDEIWLEHRFLDNGQPQTVRIGYRGIDGCPLKTGDVVKKRQRIALIAPAAENGLTQLSITLRHLVYAEAATWPQSVSGFIRSHRRLLVPAKEKRLLVAVKHAFQLHVCENGKITHCMPVALGQDGRLRKCAEGDNRTPVGEYRITQKALGPFEGTYGAYLGAAWLRLNYPNAHDARAALHEARITRQQHDAIVAAATRGGLAPAGTPLGDGIGIHGWTSDWPDGENLLTWGCLSLRKADLLRVHALVQKGTRVLILP